MSQAPFKTVALPFPLHCYDDAGLLKPPLSLYLIGLWLCKALLLMLISVSMRDNPTALIEWIYPDNRLWYQNLIPVAPGVFALISLSLRDKFREKNWLWLQKYCRTVLLCGLFGLLFLQVSTIMAQGAAFNWGQAVSLLISSTCVVYLGRSRRVGAFIADAKPHLSANEL